MYLYGIVGAGGFGREVMPLARQMLQVRHPDGDFELVFVVEGDACGIVNGHQVMSDREFLARRCTRYFNVAIGDSAVRQRIAEFLQAEGGVPFGIRAVQSVCLDDSHIGPGEILCPYSIVTSNARIGRFFHANLYSYIAHDCVIGDYVTFAPSVHCNGRVVIEDHAYIGTGAVIRQGSDERPVVIGRGAVVGMGAVVTRSVPAGATVIGNPAVPLQR